MLRVFRVLLLVCLSFGLFHSSVSAASFRDVPFDHWAHDEIRFLTDKKVIRGYDGNQFKPLVTLTRKDAAVMITRAMKLPAVSNPKVKPSDLRPTMAGYKEMMIIANKGMVTLQKNKFQPNSPLTRKEMARMLAVAYDYKGKKTSTFKDVSKSHPYYRYIDALSENDITSGYKDGTFKPDVSVNRAQFSTFLSRVYDQPHHYVVKRKGQTIHKGRSVEEAITLAVKYDDATVHPVSNSLMTYANQPAKMSGTGIHNGVLIYNGAEAPQQGSEFFAPYLKNNEKNLFDTFIFLGRTYTGGEFAETPKNNANYKEWNWYIDRTFDPSGSLSSLNKAAAEAGRTVQIYLSIPYPKSKGTIVKLNGAKEAATLQARENMVKWYIQTVQSRWNKAGYKNMKLVGYYWLNETVINANDELLVTKTAQSIHSNKKKFIYAPHSLSTNFDNWKYYGFDGAYLQPNAFRLNLNDPEARLHKAFLEAQINGSGITLEIDTYSPHQMAAGLPNFERYIQFAHKYQLVGQSLLFYQGTDMVHRMANYRQSPYEEAYQKLTSLF
ncbi:DUF4855 domain-containing protein [Bacillus sp. FJAT-42315]|uniref:DUF4855 domain-containing protein n=1 Tax=Bacillus sp. FJAT-42315 TaxID=2014077 RepID=UPI000C251278|nr:DUF4855 domain-containing protein [Bacillus sp. FJAT-42315]